MTDRRWRACRDWLPGIADNGQDDQRTGGRCQHVTQDLPFHATERSPAWQPPPPSQTREWRSCLTAWRLLTARCLVRRGPARHSPCSMPCRGRDRSYREQPVR